MTTRRILSVFVFLTAINTLQAQDRPAPEYLTTQSFPDSVNATSLTALEGQSSTLGEVLKALEGRKIVIDFWASWCKDCITGLPELHELMSKTSKDEVVYLMLSVDKDIEKWKSGISKFNIQGVHYRFDQGWKNPFSNYVDLDWIPRYLVLDEKGKVLEPKTITAGDQALQKALDSK